jgi:hypothetical protein
MPRDFIIPVDQEIYTSSLGVAATMTQITQPPVVKGQEDKYYFYITNKKINE